MDSHAEVRRNARVQQPCSRDTTPSRPPSSRLLCKTNDDTVMLTRRLHQPDLNLNRTVGAARSDAVGFATDGKRGEGWRRGGVRFGRGRCVFSRTAETITPADQTNPPPARSLLEWSHVCPCVVALEGEGQCVQGRNCSLCRRKPRAAALTSHIAPDRARRGGASGDDSGGEKVVCPVRRAGREVGCVRGPACRPVPAPCRAHTVAVKLGAGERVRARTPSARAGMVVGSGGAASGMCHCDAKNSGEVDFSVPTRIPSMSAAMTAVLSVIRRAEQSSKSKLENCF